MEEAVLSTDPADSTRFTMILRLIVVVEQIADQASVLPEPHSAFLAVDLHLLSGLAFRTDELLQLFPVERVRLRVIMTEATAVDLPTARALEIPNNQFNYRRLPSSEGSQRRDLNKSGAIGNPH